MAQSSASRIPTVAPRAHGAAHPRKGEATRAAIVEAALALARRDGLEGLTIGVLAEQMRMSKSGVFAHFGSREELQRAVLKAYAAHFVGQVLRPALRQPRGLPRLRAILNNWLALLAREIEQGCLMISGAAEYDDRDGPLREAVVEIVEGWKRELLRAIGQARDEGHLKPDIDAGQIVFEIHGLMLALHHDARLLHSRDSVKRARAGLARLLDAATSPHAGTQRPAAPSRTRRVRTAEPPACRAAKRPRARTA